MRIVPGPKWPRVSKRPCKTSFPPRSRLLPKHREVVDLRRKLREGGQLKAGDSLGDGRYLLLRKLGKGGFAVV